MILHLAALAVTVFVLAHVVPGVRVQSGGTAVVVAVVFSVLNFFLGFVLTALVGALLFLPALLTFGLVFFVVPFLVNTVLLWLTDKLIARFEITSTRSLLICAAVLTLVNGAFHSHAHWSSYGGRGYGGPHWM
jgi:putative membrane protein